MTTAHATPEGAALLKQLLTGPAFIQIAAVWGQQARAREAVRAILTGRQTDAVDARGTCAALEAELVRADEGMSEALTADDREHIAYEIGTLRGLVQALDLTIKTLLEAP